MLLPGAAQHEGSTADLDTVAAVLGDAVRAIEEQAVVDLTWIAYDSSIYRFEAAAAPSRFDAYADAFERTIESFRPLAPQERATIRAQQLHVVEATAGETLETLSRRTANVWSLEETAIMNDLDATQGLGNGLAVKVAQERPYAAR